MIVTVTTINRTTMIIMRIGITVPVEAIQVFLSAIDKEMSS